MIQVLGFDGGALSQNSFGGAFERFIHALYLLKFSGNYVAGGDTLDFSNAGGSPSAPNAIPPGARALASIALNGMGISTGLSVVNGNYVPVSPVATTPIPLASVLLMKVKIYLANGSEYTAGAYGSDVLTDIIIAEVDWAR